MNPRPSPPATAHDLTDVVRDGGVLALAGGSIALALLQVRGTWTEAFARSNTLPHGQRGVFLAALAVGVCVGVAAAMVLSMLGSSSRVRSRVRVPSLSRVARLAAPLMLSAFVPGLLREGAWTDPLKLCVCMAGFVLLFERLCRLHFEAYAPLRASYPPGDGGDPSPRWSPAVWIGSRWRRLAGPRGLRWAAALRPHAGAIVVGLVAAGYIAYASFFTLRNHARFETDTWDLGQIDNQFYNFLHGHPFRCAALIREGNWSELRNHAEAVMFFLLPIYALHPAATTLLVLQSVLLGLGGVCVYRFAARRLSQPVAVLLALSYYLYPPLHGQQFCDIHFQPVAAAFVLGAIDALDGKRMKLFVVLLGLAILCREDISVGTAVLGLFLVVTRHRARLGAVVFLVSVAYFVLLRFAIMPAFGTWGFADAYDQLLPSGEHSFTGIVKTILTNPTYTFTTLLTEEKLRYALQILVPLAFLPLRRIHLALSILPGAYFTLLTNAGPMHDIAYQYSGHFVPYIFPAAALALDQMGKQPGGGGVARRRAAVAALVAGTLLTTTHWGAIPPRKQFQVCYGRTMSFDPPTEQQRDWQRSLKELMRYVPPNAILGVTDRELPHVSNRIDTWNMSTGYQGIDYILYTTDHPIPSEREQYEAALRNGYTVAAKRPGLVLIKRPGLP